MNEPRKELLHREIQPQLRASVERAANMLDRCVNYGTHLIPKCDHAASQINALAIVMLGLHVVEALDAIAVLMRTCCVDPAKALLRSQMEAMFGIEYMAQRNTERKSVQYLVAYAHARVDWYKKLDPTQEKGKQLKAQLKKDSTFQELDIVALDTSENIANLERMLARPQYAAVEAEWQRIRQQRGGQIWWYSLFDGPRNIEGLAAAVDHHGLYEVLYRTCSGEVHATNALESLHATHDRKGEYQPLRYPTALPTVTQLAASMALRTYHGLIDMLIPSEELAYSNWYVNEIRADYAGLESFQIVDPSRRSAMPPRAGGTV